MQCFEPFLGQVVLFPVLIELGRRDPRLSSAGGDKKEEGPYVVSTNLYRVLFLQEFRTMLHFLFLQDPLY
jgi:hypothetical protein